MPDIPFSPRPAMGRYFDDFTAGQLISHASLRTISDGDISLYHALYGNQFCLQQATPLALAMGFSACPVDDIFLFNLVFGATVDDLSITAIANLGYGEGLFHHPAYVGDSLRVQSTILATKPTSDGKRGVIYAHTEAFNQHGQPLLEYKRWVLVPRAAAAIESCPTAAATGTVPTITHRWPAQPPSAHIALLGQGLAAARGPGLTTLGVHNFLPHPDCHWIQESEHMLATRLYGNAARVHFSPRPPAESGKPMRPPLVYGGHIIAIMRSLSERHFAQGCLLAAIHGGQHYHPTLAGDCLQAASMIRAITAVAPGVALAQITSIVTKDRSPTAADMALVSGQVPQATAGKATVPAELVLSLDYSLWFPA